MDGVLRSRRGTRGALLTVATLLTSVVAVAADQSVAGAVPDGGANRLWTDARGDLSISYSAATGAARFVTIGASVSLPPGHGQDAAASAALFLVRYGDAFGISDPVGDVVRDSSMSDAAGGTVVSFTQTHGDLRVFQTMLKVRVDASGGVTSAGGTWVPDVDVPEDPTIGPEAARLIAVATVLPAATTDDAAVAAPTATLGVHRDGLRDDIRVGTSRLAYEIRVADLSSEVVEDVYVDAQDGRVLERVDIAPNALDRTVFDGSNNLVWAEGDPDPIVPPGDASPDDVAEWQSAIDNAGSFYNLISSMSGRDGPDGAGGTMRSRMQVNCSFNAFSDGTSIFVCAGSAVDDVIAHEWGHALSFSVTGGMKSDVDESFGDIWGETIDQLNGVGIDTPGSVRGDTCPVDPSDPTDPANTNVRWRMGEDLFGGDASFRDMWNPICSGGVGKASDGYDPFGEPHAMASLGTHAFARAVDGGTYEGVTITPIGRTKALHVWWAAEQLMFAGANFADLAVALPAACTSLLGTELNSLSLTDPAGALSGLVITSADCATVQQIVELVEMADARFLLPPPFDRPLSDEAADVCPAGHEPLVIDSEDWESGLADWQAEIDPVDGERSAPGWTVTATLPDGALSDHAAFVPDPTGGDGPDVTSLTSPPIDLPAGTSSRLLFDHALLSEVSPYGGELVAWDGANIAVSVDGGAFSIVPASAFLHNPYNAASLGVGNPLEGQPGWAGGNDAPTWGQSVVDLSAVAPPGSTVRIRFQFGIDTATPHLPELAGWFVDDVTVYACESLTAQPQTISFDPIDDQIFGPTPVPLMASSTSMLPVSFSSASLAVCEVAGTTVVLRAAGACTIIATQAGSAAWAAATPVERTFKVGYAVVQLKPSDGAKVRRGDRLDVSFRLCDSLGDPIPLALVRAVDVVTVTLGSGQPLHMALDQKTRRFSATLPVPQGTPIGSSLSIAVEAKLGAATVAQATAVVRITK